MPGGAIVLEPHQPLVLGSGPGAAGCTVSVALEAFPRCAGHGRRRRGVRGAGAQRARHRVTGWGRRPGDGKLPPSPRPPWPSCPLHGHSWQRRSRPAGPSSSGPALPREWGPGEEDWRENGGPSLWLAPCPRREGRGGGSRPGGGLLTAVPWARETWRWWMHLGLVGFCVAWILTSFFVWFFVL